MTAPTSTAALRVLGRMLLEIDDARALTDLVDPAHFRVPEERALYLVLANATSDGYDAISIRQRVKAEAPALLPTLDAAWQALDTAETSARLARDLAAAYLADGVRDLVAHAQKRLGRDSPAEIKRDLERELAALDAVSLDGRSYDDLHAMTRRVEDWLDGDAAGGLAFGYRALDARVVPLLPGHLVIVGGASGSGKSTVIRNFLRNWIDAGQRVALFSLEMAGDEQLPNLACMDGGLDYDAYVRRTMSAEDKAYLYRGVTGWRDAGTLTLNERGGATPEYILHAMKRYRAQGSTVIIVDHLHRVTYAPDAQGNIRLAVAAFVRSLKSFAVDQQCIVIAGSQYTKGDYSDEPNDFNLREASQIAEEAHLVLHVWRPKVQGVRDPVTGTFSPVLDQHGRPILESRAENKRAEFGHDPDRVYVKIGKQRIRPVGGVVAIRFDARSGRMYDERDWQQRTAGAA